jgi:hypothetical protein
MQTDKSNGVEACWLWASTIMPNGYGIVSRDGKRVYSHRAAWEMANGPIPSGLSVLHHCDVRRCVNPAHLFIGTQADNVADCLRKNRVSRTHVGKGERGPNAKLNAKQVSEIRECRRTTGETYVSIADRYGVTPSTIRLIVIGATWREPETADRRDVGSA